MASAMPPSSSADESFGMDDYEFDPDDELEPSNEFLDAVLTRAGEFTLDLIEGVQEHPVLAASMIAAGFGLLGGLVAARVVPQRRPSIAPLPIAEPVSRAAEEASRVDFSRRMSEAQVRVSQATGAASERVRKSALFSDGLLRGLGDRARSGVGDAASVVADKTSSGPSVDSVLSNKARRVQYAGQLVPLVLALLRNPIVRDLVAQALAGRLRRTARL